MRCCRLLLLTTVVLCLSGPAANTQEWTRFRGPNGSGIGQADIPSRWTDADVRWRADLPGAGHGSPVVWGRRLFVQCDEADGGTRLTRCLDTADGSTLWTHRFPAKSHRKHAKNSFASSTPAVDEERVYVAWAIPERLTLLALDHEGNEVWNVDLGPFPGGHGYASSPIVYEDLVVLGNDHEGDGFLVAVDRRTGEVRWKAPRRSPRATYSTPCVYERPGRPPELIFTEWQHGITAVDPQTGRVNWEISVFNVNETERAIGSPIVAGDLVFGTCGFTTAQKHLVAVRPGDSGRADDVQEVFRLERSTPHIPTPLVHQGRLYVWTDKGIVTCCDARTGEELWQRRLGGNFFGSPVCVGDRLFCVNDAGEVVVLAAADQFRELARNPLGEPSQSTPAVANGTMYVRTLSGLHAIGGREKE